MPNDLERVLLDAWKSLGPMLAANPDELRARLARRRRPSFQRPLRAWCIALRANDTRIEPFNAIVTPRHAVDPTSEFHPGQYAPHTITIDHRLVQLITQPVHVLAPGEPAFEIAKRLGVKRLGLRGLRKRPDVRVRFVKGLRGRRGKPTPILYTDQTLDPNAGSKRAPDRLFHAIWHLLPQSLPEDFEQPITRLPAYPQSKIQIPSPNPQSEIRNPQSPHPRFLGWRWLCPSCRKPAKTLFYPLAPPDWGQYIGFPIPADEAALTDEHPPFFACERCHNLIRFSRATLKKSWDLLILRLSGGLLFGREVPMPAWLTESRQRPYKPRPRPARRQQTLARLLATTTQTPEQIAQTMNLKFHSLQCIRSRIFRDYGVKTRDELRAAYAATKPAETQNVARAPRP